MLSVVLPGFGGAGRRRREVPFVEAVPGFFEYLVAERGLRPSAVESYRFYLDRFEAYLSRMGAGLNEVSPALLSSYVTERALSAWPRQQCAAIAACCGSSCATRIAKACSGATCPARWSGRRSTGLATLPRSISWDEVKRVLAGVDRRTPCGKRDYAILLLLVVYGLRGRRSRR